MAQMYVQILTNYRGRRTGEHLVTPGFYVLGDPGLHGLTQADIEYLVKEQKKALIHTYPDGVQPQTIQAQAVDGITELKLKLAEKGFDVDALIAALTGQPRPVTAPIVAGVPGDTVASATETVVPAVDFGDMTAAELKEYIVNRGGVVPKHGEGSGNGGYVLKSDLESTAAALPVPSDEAV